MALASGTRVSLRYLQEVTHGVIQTGVAYEALRATGRNINSQPGIIRSNEVRSDRKQIASRQGFNQVVGSPGFELSMGAYDDLIQGALSGTWATVTTGTQNITIAGTIGKTFTRVAGNYVADGFRVGMIVDITGFTNADNLTAVARGYIREVDPLGKYLVIKKHDSTLTNYVAESGTGDEVITVVGKVCEVGTTLRTFTIERAFEDIAQFQAFGGCAINGFNLQVAANNMVSGNFDILGMNASPMSGSSVAATVTAAPTADPFTAFNGDMYANGNTYFYGPGQVSVTALNFALTNNRSLQPVVGSKFSPDVFEGTAMVSGEATVFLDGDEQYALFSSEAISSMGLRLDDTTTGEFMVFGFPAVRYNTADIDPPQQGPVPMKIQWEAQPETYSGSGCMMYVQRSV